MERDYNRRSARALGGALLVLGTLAAPAAAQQLFHYTDPEIDPQLESWEVRVDLELIRTGASAFAIVPPSGELVAVELSQFEDRRNGNVLWVGRLGHEDHDTLQFTLHNGFLVGTYSGSTGTHFRLRAQPNGHGRVELREPPADHSCGLDDDRLSEIRDPGTCGQGSWVCDDDGVGSGDSAVGPGDDGPRGALQGSQHSVVYELSVLPLVAPDAVYHWERNNSNTQTEIIALYDYANMVFRNNLLPVRIVAPPGASTADGLPSPIWAPLTLLNQEHPRFGEFPFPLRAHSASLESLRSRYSADLIELFYYSSPPIRWCGIADAIWLSDHAGNPRLAHEVARDHGMSQTNVFCSASDAIFMHEVGHLLGAMHDGAEGGVYPCFPEGGPAYSCDAYGFFLRADYANFPDFSRQETSLGTIMAYSRSRVPFFSTPRVPSPILGGPIAPSPRMANNEAVLQETGPEAAFFHEHLPSSAPVDVAVDSDTNKLYFRWPHLPVVRGALDIYYMEDPLFSEDLSQDFPPPYPGAVSSWTRIPGPYVGSPSTGVEADRPVAVTPGPGDFFAFVVCLTDNGLRVCSEPVVQDGHTYTEVEAPGNLRVTPSASVTNLVSVEWDDASAVEDGYKVQVRAASMPWRDPGERVAPLGHLVGRNDTRAYLWDLDEVGTGAEATLDFRVCAVRRWADDGCSDAVSLQRSEVSSPLVAPYYAGEGGVIGVAAGTVTVTTTCASDGVTTSRVFPADEWNNDGQTPGGAPRPAHAFNLRDYDLACRGAGELTVDGLLRGAWYYTRTDPPTAAPLFPASALTGPKPAPPTGVLVDEQSGGTWFRLGAASPNWASTIIPHVVTGGGLLVAPYYAGEGGVIGVAAGAVTVTTTCASDGVTTSRVFPADEWNNDGQTPGGAPRPAHAFNLRDYGLACRGEGELTVDGLGPGAWYYTRTDPPTAAPLFPASALTGPRPAPPTGLFVDEQSGGTWFRLGAASPNWASTIIPHVH